MEPSRGLGKYKIPPGESRRWIAAPSAISFDGVAGRGKALSPECGMDKQPPQDIIPFG
jgi:hypothetical protein